MSESSVLLEKASVFIRVCRSADALPVRVQELPLPGDLKDFRYHKISAECLADQFEHQYLVIQHKATGQTVLQPVFLSRQDLLDGLPAMLRRASGSRTGSRRGCCLWAARQVPAR